VLCSGRRRGPGAHVQIIGQIETREYVAKDGAKKSVTEIRVQRIARLERASKSETGEGAP
jgi:single-stranded DNA-binding protein